MSKSLKRVEQAIKTLNLPNTVIEMKVDTHTAPLAATAVDCALGQIVKSLIFTGQESGDAILFLTAGDQQVDLAKAKICANEPLQRADAAFIRKWTGFAIGGVAPIGHLNKVVCYLDENLTLHTKLWAAAGTPHHMFSLSPKDLQQATSARICSFADGP